MLNPNGSATQDTIRWACPALLIVLLWLGAVAVGCAGEKQIKSTAPSREDARAWLEQSQPEGHSIELDTFVVVGGTIIPLTIISIPLNENIHSYTPFGIDWETKVFYFSAVPPQEIVGHQLLKAATDSGDIWEEIGCQQIQLARLADSSGPFVLAQRCEEEGLLTWRFVVFDSTTVSTPGVGAATWSMATDPTHVHEQLVPILDSAIAEEISTRRGDGTTVVEGVEGEADSTGEITRSRYYYLVWRNGQLLHEAGDWKATGK